MSILSELQGKPKKFKIGKIELEIKPLNIDDLGFFEVSADASLKEQTENSMKLISKVLKDSVPDATDEEIKNIGMNYMGKLMDAIMEVNNMGGKEKLDIKSVIKNRQAQAKNSRTSG